MKHLQYLLVALLALVATACINDDFTTAPGDVLTFSSDSVKFDTVITRQSTATKQFVAYNRSSKQLNISSISVTSLNDEVQFFLNVDGQKGSEFHNVEVRGEDSVYVFVEAYVGEVQQNTPKELKGYITLVTNGVTQQLPITAWGQDVVRLQAVTLTADTRLTADKPYLVYDSLTVAPGATLTIDPGATLLFHDGAWLNVLGTVKAIGTQEQPITLRGDRLDQVVGQISFDIMSGQWGGVIIPAGSVGNEFHYVDMHSTSWGLQVGGTGSQQRALYLLNCVLHNSASYGLLAANAWVEAVGTEISEAADGLAVVIGGKARFTNCTLANNYLFSSIGGPNFMLFQQDENQAFEPLDCEITNCISGGLAADINVGDFTGWNVMVRNTLFKSTGEDDANFVNCVWGGDPKWLAVREDYVFDYRLGAESDAIARGDRTYVPESARYDRYGNDRFAGAGIDLGAYVYVPQAEARR